MSKDSKNRYKGDLEESKKEDSALNVNNGVDHPPQVNPHLKLKRKQMLENAEDYTRGILQGDRKILGQAITLVESTKETHRALAQEIIGKCIPHAGNSIRIGVTGVPGVGKSSFIESLGSHLTQTGNKLAVLAIDPSSARSKGSILGDKTRMSTLSTNENTFIRPSPSAGSLGGVARKTRESIFLCEAAGFDTILIETVGVGQSEVAVHSMVDFFLLLMLAGAGDELQGIKRGIMEMADMLVINKADGNNIHKAQLAQAEYKNALHLFPPPKSGWTPSVSMCSALNNTGITEVWETIGKYADLTKKNHFFWNKRKEQAKYWMYESINEALKSHFYSDKARKELIKKYENMVLNDEISSFNAAHNLLNSYFNK